MTPIRDAMRTDFVTAAPEDTLGETAEKMVDRGVGAAAVLDYGRLIGIITERDLMKAIAGRVHTSEARVHAAGDRLHQVALGDDPDQPSIVEHGGRADAAVDHLLGRLAESVLGRRGDEVRAHGVAN